MDEPPLPLEAIVVAHRDRLVRYAARLMGDLEKGRDVVQDALVRFCREPQERVAGRELEWLYTVCRNRAFDLLRREVRGRSVAAREVEQPEPEAPPASAWEALELRARGALVSWPGHPPRVNPPNAKTPAAAAAAAHGPPASP